MGVNWTQFPEERWGCSPDAPIRGNHSLHHLYDSPESGCDYLVFTHDPVEPHRAFSASFRLRHGVSPSASNHWQVTLLAGFAGGEKGAGWVGGGIEKGTGWVGEGIAVGVNLAGSDDLLKVWQIADGEWMEIVGSLLNLEQLAASAPDFHIGLELDPEGRCTLLFSGDPETDSMMVAGEGELLHWPTGRQLVVRYSYTSARDRNLWIDDLRMDGIFRKDTVAPELLDWKVAESDQLVLEFSEAPVNLSPGLFRLEAAGGELWEVSGCIREGTQVILSLAGEIPNRVDLQLHLSRICDRDGNCMEDRVVMVRRNESVWGDVVFSELMTDPAPGVGLPEQEYIELFNRSADPIDLNDWICRVDERDHHLSGALLWEGGLLAPGDFGILRGITLPNDGAELSLISSRGVLIHAVNYSVPWDAPSWKQEGGWSLESPDPERVCTSSDLLDYSQDVRGGTPGKVNSLDREVEDNENPQLLYTGFDAGLNLFSLWFTEPVRYGSWTPGQFLLLPDQIPPDSVAPASPLPDRVDIWLPESYGERAEFSVKLPFLVDCSGNLTTARKAYGGASPDPAPGMVVINEVMFRPADGLPEYVELYNPGTRYMDLQDLCLDAVKTGAAPERPLPLSFCSRLIPPGEYVVLAAHAGQLKEVYGPENSGRWVGVAPWPTLIDGGGTLYLTDRAGQTVDVMNFGEELHLELLDETAGVSLERIDPVLPGLDPSNWLSAASIAGYATPGEQNSQRSEGTGGADRLEVRPRVFSPDNDGYEDILEIIFTPERSGWVLTLLITDMDGREVCTPAGNHLTGSRSVYRWNGEMENGWMAPEGIYVVHASAYHEATRDIWKKRIAVALVYR